MDKMTKCIYLRVVCMHDYVHVCLCVCVFVCVFVCLCVCVWGAICLKTRKIELFINIDNIY